jgi:hypothetical protein
MRQLKLTAVALGGLALVTGLVLAQGRGGFGMGMGGPAALLMRQDVQKELKVTDDQLAKLKEIGEEMREKGKEAFDKADLQGLGQQERFAKMAEIMKPVNDEATKKITALLQPEQNKRLKQLQRQQAGVRAFTEKEVQDALKLSDDQKEQIKTIAKDADRERGELFKGGGGGGNFQESAKKMAAINAEGVEKVQAMLTAEQKKEWKELTGEKFEFKMEGFGGFKGKGGFRKKDKDK